MISPAYRICTSRSDRTDITTIIIRVRSSIWPCRRRHVQAIFTAVAGRAAPMTNAQSCTGRGLHGALRYRSAGELLPPLSILAEMICGLFLLHFPWSRLHRTLSGVLLYGARTFLTAYSAARVNVKYSFDFHPDFKLSDHFFTFYLFPDY